MELSGEKLNKAADYAEANFKLMWKLFSEEDRGRILTGMDEVSEDIRTLMEPELLKVKYDKTKAKQETMLND